MSRTPTLFSSTTSPRDARRLLAVDTLDRRAVVRIAYLVAIVLFAAVAAFAFHASEQRRAELFATHSGASWKQAGPVSEPAASSDAFIATWRAVRADNAGQRTLSWSVRDTRDLRASLLALDATKVAVQRIDVVRRDASFTVVAEVAP
jgi:hypothetical protein